LLSPPTTGAAPSPEVKTLMGLLHRYLRNDVARLVDGGVRLKVIGRRDRLPGHLADEIENAEAASANGKRLDLRIAIDYSARDAIACAAASWLGDDTAPRATFARLLAWQGHGTGRDVDLLIRSGGEKRLSDFLLWECAYAELCFVDTMWPDFDAETLRAAILDFRKRERRFGGLNAKPLAAAE
jgi:undecaprenyl diphosphate synthase